MTEKDKQHIIAAYDTSFKLVHDQYSGHYDMIDEISYRIFIPFEGDKILTVLQKWNYEKYPDGYYLRNPLTDERFTL